MKTIIHVNQHVIKANRKTGETKPAITVKNYKVTRYAMGVKILGESQVVYRPDKPLPCGAHVWIETEAKVVLIGEMKCSIATSNTCVLNSNIGQAKAERSKSKNTKK